MSIKMFRRSGCWRALAVTAVALASLTAFSQAPAGASSPCASGTAYYGPTSGPGAFSSPFNIIFHASTANGCKLTEVRLYIDNKTYQSYAVTAQPSGGNNGFNFPSVSAPDGYHNFVGVAWNQDGYAFRTPDSIIFVANEDQTVYITSPANDAALKNPTVYIDARTRWDPPQRPNSTTQVVHVRAYVDNADVYDTDGDHLSFYKKFASGQHYLVVIAWNHSGAYIKSSSTFFVR